MEKVAVTCALATTLPQSFNTKAVRADGQDACTEKLSARAVCIGMTVVAVHPAGGAPVREIPEVSAADGGVTHGGSTTMITDSDRTWEPVE